MVSIKKAYDLANAFFINKGYTGVLEGREVEENWAFMQKNVSADAKRFGVCVPKNGEEPFMFDESNEKAIEKYDKASIINI